MSAFAPLLGGLGSGLGNALGGGGPNVASGAPQYQGDVNSGNGGLIGARLWQTFQTQPWLLPVMLLVLAIGAKMLFGRSAAQYAATNARNETQFAAVANAACLLGQTPEHHIIANALSDRAQEKPPRCLAASGVWPVRATCFMDESWTDRHSIPTYTPAGQSLPWGLSLRWHPPNGSDGPPFFLLEKRPGEMPNFRITVTSPLNLYEPRIHDVSKAILGSTIARLVRAELHSVIKVELLGKPKPGQPYRWLVRLHPVLEPIAYSVSSEDPTPPLTQDIDVTA
ncbi:MAG: hypothetical protein ACYC26_11070 [Phycisphaerales bacterium]